MSNLKIIYAQTNVLNTEKVVKVIDLLDYINDKMPSHTAYRGDYSRGLEDALWDIKNELENDAAWPL